MANEMTSLQFQKALKADGLFAGKVDGEPSAALDRAIDARFDREALAGRLADGWQGWPPLRRKLAVEQAIIRDAGIEVGKVDGLIGPQTRFARESFQAFDQTGKPLVIPGRDETPAQPVPASGPATRWPRQSEVPAFYGAMEQNQAMLRLPYEMRLSWEPQTRITRFSCHEKVHDAFLRVFQKTLAEYGEMRIQELRLDLFGGCLNKRLMKGGTQMSMHSWGIAVDLDPERNALRMTHREAAFARPEYEPFWRIVEGEGLVSLGRARDFDWMHFQAARL
ncbi:M15 family metallopeptidase [Neoroseomonas soli]|uniref:M15 family metallopeptidase n=1 Tax=Neoroseomonas soli TaxID=1081025 RepID=A0A9X9WXZ5_9PROT|nr:M15 family metallopeptidase [Neoroseomonas soli]MBR0672024.1 M15 family metallopeptidase [Neoroseomonas soli]